MTINRSRIVPLLAALFLISGALAVADAAPIVVDWDVVPHNTQHIEPGDSPFYDCFGDHYTDRRCSALWEQGLELSAVLHSFFDDKFVDGFGLGVDEADIGTGGVQRIHPVCKSGFDPCFDSFTPVTLRIEGDSNGGPAPNIFIHSSRGGLMKAPALLGLGTFNLSGSDWEDLDWLEVGFYIASDCEFEECSRTTEKALVVRDLSFNGHAVVPEPGLLALLAAGALGIGVRRYRS